jgi:MFS family permease
VEPRDVARANALVAGTSSAAYLAGPLLGGLMLGAGASPSTVFAVDAATFVVSAFLVATIRAPFGSGATGEHPGMLTGFRVIVRDARLRVPVLAGTISLVGVGIVNVASYPLSLDLHGGTQGYGAMTALLGGGGLLGTALAGRVLATGSSRVLPWSFAAGAAGLALAGAAPMLGLALGGMAVAGAGRGLGDVAATTLIQERTDDAVRSRVFAAQEGAAHAAFSVSALSGGLIVELLSARGAFAVATAFGVTAMAVAATSRSRRTAEPHTPSPARRG